MRCTACPSSIGVNFHPVHGSGPNHFWGMIRAKHWLTRRSFDKCKKSVILSYPMSVYFTHTLSSFVVLSLFGWLFDFTTLATNSRHNTLINLTNVSAMSPDTLVIALHFSPLNTVAETWYWGWGTGRRRKNLMSLQKYRILGNVMFLQNKSQII